MLSATLMTNGPMLEIDFFSPQSQPDIADALSFVIICARTVEDAQRILDERFTEGGWEAPTNIGKAGKSVNNGIIELVIGTGRN